MAADAAIRVGLFRRRTVLIESDFFHRRSAGGGRLLESFMEKSFVDIPLQHGRTGLPGLCGLHAALARAGELDCAFGSAAVLPDGSLLGSALAHRPLAREQRRQSLADG